MGPVRVAARRPGSRLAEDVPLVVDFGGGHDRQVAITGSSGGTVRTLWAATCSSRARRRAGRWAQPCFEPATEIEADRWIENPTDSRPLGSAFLTQRALDISPPLGDPPRRKLRRSSTQGQSKPAAHPALTVAAPHRDGRAHKPQMGACVCGQFAARAATSAERAPPYSRTFSVLCGSLGFAARGAYGAGTAAV